MELKFGEQTTFLLLWWLACCMQKSCSKMRDTLASSWFYRLAFVGVVLLLILPVWLSAQSVERSFVPKWTDARYVHPFMEPTYTVPAPAFEGCVYDERIYNLPYQALQVLHPGTAHATYGLLTTSQMEETESLEFFDALAQVADVDALFRGSEWYPASPMQHIPLQQGGQALSVLHLYPIQLHRSGTRIRTWRALHYSELAPAAAVATTQQALGKTQNTPTSKLATGVWHQLAISETGIYKIDKAFLEGMGISTAGLDPRNLQLYGKGGGMLPQQNSAFRHDDLPEVAIQVVGEADGVWNDGDYLLFYGLGPHVLVYDSLDKRMRQQNHLYTDRTHYYLTVGQSAGKRISLQPAATTADSVVSRLRHLAYWNLDQHNLNESGRLWFGQEFRGSSLSFTFSLATPGAVPNGQHRLYARVAGRSDNATTFQLGEGSSSLGSIGCQPVNTGCSYCDRADIRENVWALGGDRLQDGAQVSVSYSGGQNTQGWLDYLNVDYERSLSLDVPFFQGFIPIGRARTLGLDFAGGTAQHQLWLVNDPTTPAALDYQLSGSTLSTRLTASQSPWLVAFTPAAHQLPQYVGTVANQNLHGLPQAEYLIISDPDFVPAAQRLGQWHQQHDGLRFHVVSPGQIYQEFSSGMPDITALRDFIRMFWLRAGSNAAERPRYVLLFGDASYDYKGYETQPSRVPAYQARESNFPPSAFVSDDFYAFMDANEGLWGEGNAEDWQDRVRQTHTMDLAVGRLPVNSVAEAEAMVDKIIGYGTRGRQDDPWKNRILFVGDVYRDECNHHTEADNLAKNTVATEAPCMVAQKVYLDAYPSVNGADGVQYPIAQQQMIDRINRGALVVNYTGHGGEDGLSNSRILELNDISNLQNEGREAIWITATCDFGRCDVPSFPSGAERLLLKSKGGAIALITSTREVFSAGNFVFNQNTYQHFFDRTADGSRYLTLGEVMQQAKNASWSSYEINTRNFMLMGDPAMRIGLPEYEAVITEINGQALVPGQIDTLKALGRVSLRGELRQPGGGRLSNFEGTVYASIYDKAQRSTTSRCQFQFDEQRNILFNGRATVSQGAFTLEFVVPLDIDYTPGLGQISLFATSADQEAAGCTRQIAVCCTDPNPVQSLGPPTINLYLNSPNWRSGNLTDPNPDLMAEVYSDVGINTSGLGIGRELTAVLDGNTIEPILLNDYYTTVEDSYQRGSILYAFENLAEGPHSLKVRVWDVANRSATAETQFVVASRVSTAVDHVLNYPNPFTESTRFQLNHNQVGTPLRIQVRIYDQAGNLATQLDSRLTPSSYVLDHLSWEGQRADGSPLQKGIYLYEIRVTNEESGEVVRKYSRLVLMK